MYIIYVPLRNKELLKVEKLHNLNNLKHFIHMSKIFRSSTGVRRSIKYLYLWNGNIIYCIQ